MKKLLLLTLVILSALFFVRLTTGQKGISITEKFRLETDPIIFVSWSPDGDYLGSLTVGESIATVWETDTFSVSSTFLEHEAPTIAFGWNHDQTLMTTLSSSSYLSVWDVESHERLSFTALIGGIPLPDTHPVTSVYAMEWQPDSDIVTVSLNGGIVFFDTATGDIETFFTEDEYYHILGIDWCADGSKLATYNLFGESFIIDRVSNEITTLSNEDPLNLQPLHILADNPPQIPPQSVDFNVDCTTLAVIGDVLLNEDETRGIYTASIIDVERGEIIARLNGHDDHIYAVAWSYDGQFIATVSGDRTVKIWDGNTFELLATIDGFEDAVTTVDWHPTQNLLAAGSLDGLISIWKITYEPLEN